MEYITRWIKRKYNELMFKDITIWSDWDFKMDPYNLQLATDYLVMAMEEIDQKTLDNMKDTEYEKLAKKYLDMMNSPCL